MRRQQHHSCVVGGVDGGVVDDGVDGVGACMFDDVSVGVVSVVGGVVMCDGVIGGVVVDVADVGVGVDAGVGVGGDVVYVHVVVVVHVVVYVVIIAGGRVGVAAVVVGVVGCIDNVFFCWY